MAPADMSESLAVEVGGVVLPMTVELLERYNVQGPRYTSYPTAPEWSEAFGVPDAELAMSEANGARRPVSLYLHLPFCEEQCWFCGCFMKVVPRPSRENERGEIASYLEALHREIDLVADRVDPSRPVVQAHWGGGTPTYLTVRQADELAAHLFARFPLAPGAEVSVEVDPRVTTREHLELLRSRGFNRVSMGVQDFDPDVQELMHRVQPFDMTAELVAAARELGYLSVNLDLIYGLPGQRRDSFGDSVDRVVSLRPDRVAMYSYAHVPWLKRPQKVMEAHLPEGAEKFRIFCKGIETFTRAGYVYIGMDHFALPHDALVKAQQDRTLHRNFQGYTTWAGTDLYGLGISAIGSVADRYLQNGKDYVSYRSAVMEGRLATYRGWSCSPEDLLRREVIGRILCHCILVKAEIERDFGLASFDETFGSELAALRPLEADGLVELGADAIRVTPLGRIFVRNVAMAFDAYLHRREGQSKIFSRTL